VRRTALAVLATLSIAGCAAGAPSSASGGSSPVPVPSKACGGFHLLVTNAGTSAIAVRLNGQAITTVEPGGTADIAQYGNHPAPAMPWEVDARRVKDGAVVFTAHLDNDGTDGRRVQVSDALAGDLALTPFVC
jgi:hypothetical protein